VTSQPSAHLLLLQEAAAKKGSNEISDVITRLLAQLTGLAVLSVAGLGTLLVTAKDKNSLYKRTAGLFAVAARRSHRLRLGSNP